MPRALVLDNRGALILGVALAPWTAWRAVRRAWRQR